MTDLQKAKAFNGTKHHTKPKPSPQELLKEYVDNQPLSYRKLAAKYNVTSTVIFRNLHRALPSDMSMKEYLREQGIC